MLKKDLELAEKETVPASSRILTRREWVQRMLAGTSIGVVTPGFAKEHFPYLATSPAIASMLAEAVGDEWKPTFFDDHQNQTLVVLAERIVPGSTEAQVNRFLDTALNADTQESQQKFVASLNAMDGESLHRFTEPFKDLSVNQQEEILTAASTAQPSAPGFSRGDVDETRPGAESSLPNLRDYFDHLKDWISMAYYSSEVGMKELGWTGENFFASFPGCQHADGHS